MPRELQQPTVILMDRIDVGLQSPQLDYQFWWAIRALITNYSIFRLSEIQSDNILNPDRG
jgi:hypothetical protein